MVIKTGFFDNAQEKQRDKKEVAVRKGVKNMNWKELPAMDDDARCHISKMNITIIDDFDLDRIACSGQCFRWEKLAAGSYRIC